MESQRVKQPVEKINGSRLRSISKLLPCDGDHGDGAKVGVEVIGLRIISASSLQEDNTKENVQEYSHPKPTDEGSHVTLYVQ